MLTLPVEDLSPSIDVGWEIRDLLFAPSCRASLEYLFIYLFIDRASAFSTLHHSWTTRHKQM